MDMEDDLIELEEALTKLRTHEKQTNDWVNCTRWLTELYEIKLKQLEGE